MLILDITLFAALVKLSLHVEKPWVPALILSLVKTILALVAFQEFEALFGLVYGFSFFAVSWAYFCLLQRIGLASLPWWLLIIAGVLVLFFFI